MVPRVSLEAAEDAAAAEGGGLVVESGWLGESRLAGGCAW